MPSYEFIRTLTDICSDRGSISSHDPSPATFRTHLPPIFQMAIFPLIRPDARLGLNILIDYMV